MVAHRHLDRVLSLKEILRRTQVEAILGDYGLGREVRTINRELDARRIHARAHVAE